MADEPIVVPPLPEAAVLDDGTKVATPEVGLDHPAVVELQETVAALPGVVEAKATELAAATEAKAVDVATAATGTAAALAVAATEKAVALALKAAAIDKATSLRNQHVDHVLEEHGTHLASIDANLADLTGKVLTRDDYKITHDALVQSVRELTSGLSAMATADQVSIALRGRKLSRRQTIVGSAGAAVGVITFVVGLLASTGHL